MKRIVNRERQPRYWVMASLWALAIIANLFPLPFFDPDQIYVGNAFAIVAALIYGLPFGLLVSVTANSLTYLNFEHFLVVPIFALEVAIFYIALRRQRSILLWPMIYWLSLGWPLVYAIYNFVGLGYAEELVQGITIKYLLNGLFNTILAFSVFHLLRAFRIEPRVHFSNSVKTILYNFGLVCILFSASILTYFWLQSVNTSLYDSARKSVASAAAGLQNELNGFLQSHLTALQQASAQFAADVSNDDLQRALKAVHLQYDNFATLLATDTRGNVLSASPASLLEQAPVGTDSFNVADREYFWQIMAGEPSFISGAFRGRGFGTHPIVALSVPYYRQGQLAGILEGSLNLQKLSGLSDRLPSPEARYMIIDANDTIVFASPQMQIPSLAQARDYPITSINQVSGGERFSDYGDDLVIIEQAQLDDLNWRILVLQSASSYEQQLNQYVSVSFVILAFMLVVGVLLVSSLSRWFLLPLSSFQERLRGTIERNAYKELQNVKQGSATYVVELRQLEQDFISFADVIVRTMSNLTLAADHNKRLNSKLTQVNQELEQRVLERTQDLNDALEKVKEASDAKAQFFANMSHEIRTPLHAIIGLTDVLRIYNKEPEFDEKLEIIATSARQLMDLLNDLLDLSALDFGKFKLNIEEVNIRQQAQATERLYQSLAEQQHLTWTVAVSNNVNQTIVTDPQRVNQILNNLISNAFKYTDSGYVRLRIHQDDLNQKLVITVADSGTGMTPDVVAKIFDPYQRGTLSTNNEIKGTGLGLAIVGELVTLLGGDISCSSKLNHGTTFKVRLPLSGEHFGHLVE